MAGERILVVDDDPAGRAMVQAALSAKGYAVRAAEHGLAALKALDEAPADLVLTDLNMPEMDGYALLKELRRRSPDLAVVVFSAVGMDHQVVRCMEAGATDFLHKPFPLARLMETAKRALAQRGARPPLDLHYEKSGWLELTADSAFDTVERFRTLVERLTERQIPPDVADPLRFALDELGRNAVEWGNRGREGKQVHLSYCLFEDKMMFKIEDEGEGFDPGAVPDPTADPVGAQARREEAGKRVGGYGIHLVRKLMDEVLFSERGNVVIMTKHLPAAPRG